MLQIAQWGAAAGYPASSSWVWSDRFVADFAEFEKKYPRGSESNRHVNMVCSYFETLATLWKHGLFHEDLLFDWLAVSMVWDRVSGYALGARQAGGNPRIYENFEALANAQVAYHAKLAKRAARGKRPRKK